jgi:hypothetical protein
LGEKKPLTTQWLIGEGLRAVAQRPVQAIETAIKANKNINTPPTIGSTMGIKGTIASTGSISVLAWAVSWLAGADMVVFQKREMTRF